jgi:hypothetical protein
MFETVLFPLDQSREAIEAASQSPELGTQPSQQVDPVVGGSVRAP